MKKLYNLQNIILDNRNSPNTWGEARIPFVIAEIYMRLNDTASAFNYLNKAAQAAKRFDERPDKQQLNSLLLGEIVQKRTDFQTSDTRSLCEIMKETWLSDAEFNAVRNTDEYKGIIEIMK